MKRLILRALPLATATLGGTLGYLQFTFPLWYPWPLLALFLTFTLAAFLFAKENKGVWMQTMTQMIPPAFFLLALGVSFLLVESIFVKWLITTLLFLTPLMSLELLYLAYFETFHYPVNGISRLNIAYIPAIAFLMAVSFNGLYVFLRLSSLYGLISFPIIIATLYFVTSHPTADVRHNTRWSMLGAMLGLQVAILVFILPVPLAVQGALAAILVSVPLRIRRYAYAPTPSKRHAWIEGSLAMIFFLTILLISPWA